MVISLQFVDTPLRLKLFFPIENVYRRLALGPSQQQQCGIKNVFWNLRLLFWEVLGLVDSLLSCTQMT